MPVEYNKADRRHSNAEVKPETGGFPNRDSCHAQVCKRGSTIELIKTKLSRISFFRLPEARQPKSTTAKINIEVESPEADMNEVEEFESDVRRVTDIDSMQCFQSGECEASFYKSTSGI